jgi:outer membrane protein assembly factor BamB
MKSEIKIDIDYPITASPVVFDVNSDGIDELIITADKIYIFETLNFNLIKTFQARAPFASTPEIYISKNGIKFIVAGSDDDELHFFPLDAQIKPFSFKTNGDVFSSPLIKDIDADGFDEVIFGSDDCNLYTLKINEEAEIIDVKTFKTNGFVSSSPTLFPRDEFTFDIVIGSWDENIYRVDGSNLTAKWQTPLSNFIWSSPAVCDLNGDDKFEIICVSSSIFIINESGEVIGSKPLGSFTVSSPAICDIDEDGFAEIISLADGVYIFKPNLSLKANFPIKFKSTFWASPVICDVNGDGVQEIIACDYNGNIWVLNDKGELIPEFIKKVGTSIVATPLAIDIDKDGLIELVICTMDGKVCIIPTKGKNSKWGKFRGDGNGFVTKKFKFFEEPVNIEKIDNDSEPKILNAKIKKVRQGRVKMFELNLKIENASFKKAVMYFFKFGGWFPSPIFGDGENFIARFPPFRKFSIVKWFVELQNYDRKILKFPEKGFKFFLAI